MSSQGLMIPCHDKQMGALVEGQNWKQALSLCEKRLKKGVQTEELLVLKAIFLLNQPEIVRKLQGQKAVCDILERRPPISELTALENLNTITRRCDFHPSIATIWERAITVRPGDENIYEAWFRAKFNERNWKAAQKAAISYMKKFQEKREPFFWNIFTCELAGLNEKSSDTERKILRPLAYGFLSRAIREAESENQSRGSNHGRTIQTLEELLLLLRVYRSQERYEEAIAVLDSSRTGIASPVGNHSWELVRQKLEIYGECNRWKDLWQFCHELLIDALPSKKRDSEGPPFHTFNKFGDDWKVWVGLVTAAIKIGTREFATLTETLIDSYIHPDTISRNARLASLKFYAEMSVMENDSLRSEYVQEDLFNACFDYFSNYSMKSVCFHDLRPHVSCLSRHRQEKFLKHIARNCRSHRPKSKDSDSRVISWITAEINALKCDYFLLVSRTDIPSRLNLLKSFVSNCLRLFKLSLPLGSKFPPSERRPGDDAAILAVMGLVHISLEGGWRDNSIFRGIIILEALIAQSRCNYDALLVLVRLYVTVGMGSLAMHYYAQLSIKNVQNATMSWVLFTRISTIHPLNPYPIGNETSFDLLENLRKVLEWGKTADRLCNTSANSMLNYGQYNMAIDMLTSFEFGSSNFTTRLVSVEMQRVARFSELPSLKEVAWTNAEMPDHAQDVRDLKPFPDCEAPGQRRFVDYLHTSTPPNDYWLATQLRQIRLWGFLHKHHADLNNSEIDRVIYESKFSGGAGLTPTEAQVESVTLTLEVICDMALSTIHHPPIPIDEIEHFRRSVRGHIKDVYDWFATAAAGLRSATAHLLFTRQTDLAYLSWYYFHATFHSLDACRFTLATIRYLEGHEQLLAVFEPDSLNGELAQLKNRVREVCTGLRKHAVEIRDMLQKPETVRQMLQAILCDSVDSEDPIGKELQEMVDESWLDEIIQKLRRSWVEALNGIGDVKVF